jgi:ADP-ribose pyrophosphatase
MPSLADSLILASIALLLTTRSASSDLYSHLAAGVLAYALLCRVCTSSYYSSLFDTDETAETAETAETPAHANANANANANTTGHEHSSESRPRKLHTNARQDHPSYRLQRVPVPDDAVSWDTPFPGYAPPDYTHRAVIEYNRFARGDGWADPMFGAPGFEFRDTSYERHLSRTSAAKRGCPLNPFGRTGMCGRGLLGKWGANHAADPIVTRWVDRDGTWVLQLVVVKRKDTGDWALPGGMVDDGETVSETVRREFGEEAANQPTAALQVQCNRLLDELFAPSPPSPLSRTNREVYRGYVDDPRNTDNSWMETCVMHYHCASELGHLLPLHEGDDAAEVRWLDTDSPEMKTLYASHCDYVRMALEVFLKEQQGLAKMEAVFNAVDFLSEQ